MKAIVKQPEYPFHPWLLSLAGQEIEVEKKDDGYFYQVRADGRPGFILSKTELIFPDETKAA